ncbi:antitoxin Xre/MbcA/ParS toxin-binding domain-containing protein [Phaeospirillum tilakii]|uniref:Antitoxin Xre/MbcA/ParS toxin-binding domain-containing protein n=1 Tax=Phaeospirillum tilakii TaxID=741673 RepID=A0ABW5C6B9_9PROT
MSEAVGVDEVVKLLGGREEAERWLEQPALGLDRRRPIELLATPAGTQLVEDYLTRLEYGVHM